MINIIFLFKFLLFFSYIFVMITDKIKWRRDMKNILLVLFSVTLLSAQDTTATKNCLKVTSSFKVMSDGTKINHENIMALTKMLNDSNVSKDKRDNARKELKDMNQKTADRALNSQYPAVYAEMKQAYIVNCGTFTSENNTTISGLIERSVDFNNIMAKALEDKLSISKVQ